MKERKTWIGVLLLIPLITLIAVFYLYPIFKMSSLSLYSTKFGFGDLEFSGLKNFQKITEIPAFWPAVKNSALWTLLSLIIQLSIPVGLALLLNARLPGIAVARSTILIPWVTPAVVIALMWRWILEPTMGILNEQLFNYGLVDSKINFFGSPSIALLTLIVINSLKYLPFGTLLILAALQNIPRDLYEAMRVDGAGGVQQLRYLVMPLLTPMIGFMGFLVLVWNFNVFDLIDMTTKGGPANSTMTIPVLIYRTAYRTFNMGQAGALAVLVILVMTAAGILYFRYVWRGAGGEER